MPRLRSTVVLCYHRVAAPRADPHGLCVHPERFADQLRALAHVADPVPLSEVVRAGRGPRIAVTFDDGYADSLDAALPLLSEAGVPAAFFITTGTLNRDEFWWDRLARLLLHDSAGARLLALELAGRRLWLDARSPAARERAHWALWHRLRVRPEEEIAALLDHLEGTIGAPAASPARPLTDAELGALAAAEGVDIGAHSVTHPSLAAHPVSVQRGEITGSRTHLEQLLGRPVRFFAYPYGGPQDVNDDTVRCVAAAGFAGAFTTMAAPVRRRHDPRLLPRLVVRDWDGQRLVRELGAVSR